MTISPMRECLKFALDSQSISKQSNEISSREAKWLPFLIYIIHRSLKNKVDLNIENEFEPD